MQWRFVMAADHPLANVEEPLTEAQLRRFPAVNIEDSARTLTKRVARRLPGQRDYCSRYGTKSPPIWRAWALVCQNHFASQCSIINNWSAG
ncbi:hypothetical protein DMI69_24880 [Escherichia coli]|nr:hypothetical protein [Escherichia coli]